MSCCNQIDSRVIMAVLLNAGENLEFSYEQMEAFYHHLCEVNPVYVVSDFEKAKIREEAESYPEVFNLKEDGDTFILTHGKLYPNMDYFMSIYPDSVRSFIENIGIYWVKEKMGE